MAIKAILTGSLVTLACLANAQVPGYVPTNGLKGFWPFCNNANDVSGNGNNGTVSGAVLTADRFNISSMAYSFNGNSDFISTTMTGILGNNARAVSFWAKTNDGSSTMCGVSWGDEQSNPNFGVRWECAFNYGSAGATIIGSDCAITYSTPSPVNDGNWHHYVYQYNAGVDWTFVQIYQDAVLLTTALHSHNSYAPINTSNNWSVNFGQIPYVIPHYFNGSLDEIGIWDRALTLTEIQQLKNGDGRCGGTPDGLSQSELDNLHINVYPNPSNGHFTVSSDTNIELKVKNALGQLVYEKKISANTSTQINDLPAGIYFITNSDGQFRKKIIVNK